VDAPSPGSPVVIRRATAADARELARLRWVFRAELVEPTESEAEFVARAGSWMADRLGTDPRWLCWVAEQGTAIVGTLWLHQIEKLPNPVDEPEDHAYITSVYVLPEHRGGLGGRLMETALAWCHEADVDAVLLWPSGRSRSLYERYGFGVRDDLFALRPIGRR
jgi:ribosomal protein S18 acetylase RimI-like enzyme